MAASGRDVFEKGEYWRLWTTLFAHADLGHLLSNAFLFVPLTYMLVSHYSFWYFPLAGLFFGGLTNWLVLQTLPSQAYLIGISGVVYWMGSSWLTLYLLIDRRDRLRRRIGASLFLTLMLFVPETLKPEVSHLSHFLGYVIGVASAFLYYRLNRRRFLAAEVREYIFEPEEIFEETPITQEREEPHSFNIHN
jgi:rhomboid protease GluP